MNKELEAVLVLGSYYSFIVSFLMCVLWLVYKIDGKHKRFQDFLAAKG